MNEKEKAQLNVSLIPLVIIVGLIFGAGYFLLKDEISLPKFNRGPTMRRLEGFSTLVYVDDDFELERKKVVIKNQDELNEFLNAIDKSGLLELRESINFDKEIILAVNSEVHEETGHRTKIDRIYEDSTENRLIVLLEEKEAGDKCNEDPDRNVTLDIVALSKTDLDITFDRVKKVEECE
ncbi:MAG: hypothetical protein ABIA11_03010 [Patescibacteria group bacterium]